MSARQFQRCVQGPSPHASACAVGVGSAERRRTSPRGPAARSNGTDMALLSAGALAESAIGFDARPGGGCAEAFKTPLPTLPGSQCRSPCAGSSALSDPPPRLPEFHRNPPVSHPCRAVELAIQWTQ